MHGQSLHCLFLFGRTTDGWMFRVGSGEQLPEHVLTCQRRLALAQQHGQRAAQGVAQAMLIIAGCPAAQLPETVGQQRLVVQQLRCLLQLAGGYAGMLGDAGNQAYQLTVAEGDPDPGTNRQMLGAHPGRPAVIEQATQWGGQGNLDDRSWHVGGYPSLSDS